MIYITGQSVRGVRPNYAIKSSFNETSSHKNTINLNEYLESMSHVRSKGIWIGMLNYYRVNVMPNHNWTRVPWNITTTRSSLPLNWLIILIEILTWTDKQPGASFRSLCSLLCCPVHNETNRNEWFRKGSALALALSGGETEGSEPG